MCDLATAMAVGGMVLQVSSFMQEGRAAQAQAQQSAAIATHNAGISRENARDAVDRGHYDQIEQNRENSHFLAQQKVSQVKSGVDVGFGSPLEVALASQAQGSLDALTIRKNSYREALGYTTNARSYEMQADLDRKSGDNEAKSSLLNAGGALVGGAADAYGVYRKQKVGQRKSKK